MKCEITKDGYIKITAETCAEAFAIEHLLPVNTDTMCEVCGNIDQRLLLDCSVLNKTEDVSIGKVRNRFECKHRNGYWNYGNMVDDNIVEVCKDCGEQKEDK